MRKTHGNCLHWTSESATHVQCSFGGMIECLYSKHGNAQKCPFWKARPAEVHEQVYEIEANYYRGDTKPIAVFVRCMSGKTYVVSDGYVTRARISRWKSVLVDYSEDGGAYTRIIWRGAPYMSIVVPEGSEYRGRSGRV